MNYISNETIRNYEENMLLGCVLFATPFSGKYLKIYGIPTGNYSRLFKSDRFKELDIS